MNDIKRRPEGGRPKCVSSFYAYLFPALFLFVCCCFQRRNGRVGKPSFPRRQSPLQSHFQELTYIEEAAFLLLRMPLVFLHAVRRRDSWGTAKSANGVSDEKATRRSKCVRVLLGTWTATPFIERRSVCPFPVTPIWRPW